MRYSEPLLHQVDVFLVFLGVGFLLGAFYVIVAFFRRLAGESAAACYVCDSLFCLVGALVFFFFLLAYANGRVRINLCVAAAAGFAAFSFSLGRPLRRLLFAFSDGVRRCAKCLWIPVRRGCLALQNGVKTAARSLKNAHPLRWTRKKRTTSTKN